MIIIVRLAIILIMPALLWLGWTLSPDIISANNMRYLSAIFLTVWGIAFHFLRKSSDLSSLPGLSGREQERIILRLAEIRKRIWWISGIVLIASILVWIIGFMPAVAKSDFAPLSIGLLVGIGASYLIVIPGWFNELYDFTDAIRMREDKKRRAESVLKQIADSKKNGSRNASSKT